MVFIVLKIPILVHYAEAPRAASEMEAAAAGSDWLFRRAPEVLCVLPVTEGDVVPQ